VLTRAEHLVMVRGKKNSRGTVLGKGLSDMVLGKKQSGTVLEHDCRSFPWKAVCFALQNVLTVQTDSGACGSIHCGLKCTHAHVQRYRQCKCKGKAREMSCLARKYLFVGSKVKTGCACDK